jgi:hypothetical protein
MPWRECSWQDRIPNEVGLVFGSITCAEAVVVGDAPTDT